MKTESLLVATCPLSLTLHESSPRTALGPGLPFPAVGPVASAVPIGVLVTGHCLLPGSWDISPLPSVGSARAGRGLKPLALETHRDLRKAGGGWARAMGNKFAHGPQGWVGVGSRQARGLWSGPGTVLGAGDGTWMEQCPSVSRSALPPALLP